MEGSRQKSARRPRRDWDKANYLRQQQLALLEEQKRELEKKEPSEARDNLLASLQNKIDELKATTPTDDNLPNPAASTRQDTYPHL